MGGQLHCGKLIGLEPSGGSDRVTSDAGWQRTRNRFRADARCTPLELGRDVQRVLVVARQGVSPVGPDDPASVRATVERAEYARQDFWTLNLPSRRSVAQIDGSEPSVTMGGHSVPETGTTDAGPWYIRVYSVLDADGLRATSPGLEPSAATILPGPNPEVTVSYVLKRPWLPGLAWSVTFRTEPPGSDVPCMVLVAHPRAVPLSVDDGQIVAHFPRSRDGARFPIRSPMNLSQHGIRVFPDPNLEPDSLKPIRLRHPESAATRV